MKIVHYDKMEDIQVNLECNKNKLHYLRAFYISVHSQLDKVLRCVKPVILRNPSEHQCNVMLCNVSNSLFSIVDKGYKDSSTAYVRPVLFYRYALLWVALCAFFNSQC